MKPQTTNDKRGVSFWINLLIAVLSALTGALGAQAANMHHVFG